MKKILTILAAFLVTAFLGASASFAATAATTTTNWDSAAAVKRVNTIGSKIMTANNLPKGITFKVSEEDHVNAYANMDKEVFVYKGLLEFVQNDQELAAVIAHEVGHIINAHCAKQGIINYGSDIAASAASSKLSAGSSTALNVGKELAMLKMSRTDEYDADLTGVDLMVKAGYDPKAMISVLNKICENTVDVISTHPSGINRLMNIYDYLEYSYPNTVKVAYATDSYKNAKAAIDVNVKARNSKKNGEKKQKEKMAKLQAKRVKQMAKNTSRTTDPWTSGVTVINSLNAVNQLTK